MAEVAARGYVVAAQAGGYYAFGAGVRQDVAVADDLGAQPGTEVEA